MMFGILIPFRALLQLDWETPPTKLKFNFQEAFELPVTAVFIKQRLPYWKLVT